MESNLLIDYKINLIKTNLEDCYIIETNRFGDERGYFTSITDKQLKILGFKGMFQKSESLSSKGTIRGLHYQLDPYCQAKVVYCTKGKVLDVVVDIRIDSPTYGEYTMVELNPENGRMLYVPRGFAHGFMALEKDSTFNYMVDNEYTPKMEGGILWDPCILEKIKKEFNIENIILSDKDQKWLPLSETKINFTKKQKRFLITGVNGQLGYDIKRELLSRGIDEKCILAIDKDLMDITDRGQVLKVFETFKPDVVYHCAAWTAVDKAEENQEVCELVNVTGTKNITDASIKVGAKLFYMSTDYVFDGTINGDYNENNLVNPLSVYGKTKYAGEEEVRRNLNHFITRISWVFGINGGNFIKTMLRVGENREFVTVVDDQIGSPTYTVDLAKLLVKMAYTEKYGTYNVTNSGFCSWAEFCEEFYNEMGYGTTVKKVTTEEYYAGKDMSKIAPRPMNSKLDKTKLEENFELLPTWEDATKRYCKELKNNPVWNTFRK